MDLEHLNKSQIVLLTLLVSFVTSVATGIVTATLLEEAPPAIAQTVNRVVERTVERIVPSGQAAGAATTEKTVVVKESDLIAQAVSTIQPSIVRLYTPGRDLDGRDIDVFLGIGIVVNANGTIVTDSATLPSGVITVVRSDGVRVSGTSKSSDSSIGLTLIEVPTTIGEGKSSEWKPAKLANKEPPLGKAIVAISGKDSTRIGEGIVTALAIPADEADMERNLETNVPVGAIAFGSPLVDADGQILGISTSVSRSLSENAFLASTAIIMYTNPKAPAENNPNQ